MKQRIVNTVKNYRPPKFVIGILLLLPLVFTYIKNLKLDSDIWFLLNHGRYVLENGFTRMEPFTIHSNFSFVMQQWLSASIFWIIYKYLGELGLRLFLVIFIVLIIFIVYKLCILLSENKFYLSSSITIIIAMLLSAFYIVNRPQIFSCIIFLLEFYVLELYIKRKNNKYLYILPILSLLLINLHASMWFMLFLFMLPYLLDSFKFNLGFIKSEGYNKKPLFVVLILMLLVGFINPYGIDAITYIFGSYGINEINEIIGEMKVLNINDLFGKIAYTTIFIVTFIYIFYKNGNLKLRYFLLYCGSLYMALSNNKSFMLFIIASIFPLAYYLKDKFNVYIDKFGKYPKKIQIIYKCVCFVALIIGVLSLIKNITNKTYNNLEIPTKDSVEYIVNNYDISNVKVYTGFNDGAYAQFNGLRTYMDARAEVFLKANNKKEDIFLEYYNLQYTNIDCNEFLNKYNFDLLILAKDDKLNMCLDNYTEVHKDENRSVYEKR